MSQHRKGLSNFESSRTPIEFMSVVHDARLLKLAICLAIVSLVVGSVARAQTPIDLNRATVLEKNLPARAAHQYALRLGRNESAEIVIRQQGVDVVVQVRSPSGKLLDEIDSPTGRNGDEVVEIISEEDGVYHLLVRPYDQNEPAGVYRLQVRALRGTRETTELLNQRREARSEATKWLSQFSMAIPRSGALPSSMNPARLAGLARRTRVVGIGEATHGSREFADFRLSLSRYLIQHHQFRILAIEASVNSLALLEPYLNGKSELTQAMTRAIESGWIGRRSRREIIKWIHSWNINHPRDRVRLVGVDPQENAPARKTLGEFLVRAYGEEMRKRWEPVERELAAADEQTAVFGDSGVDASARQMLLEMAARLELDAPILNQKFGDSAVRSAIEAARILAEFADFNSNSPGGINHSRDWYMAGRVLRALDEGGPAAKVIYWAHNAHVAHPPGSERTSGALLKAVLGCDYRALALTFGEGSFVAQIPNDLEDRLAFSTLPWAPAESIESVLSDLHSEGALAMWPCASSSPGSSSPLERTASKPAWLRAPRPMHWVGGLFTPGSLPSTAFRSFDLLSDFDGVLFLPLVTADELPRDRPLIPARKRQ
jgi:erythromycin esterase